jgi:diguanylate cyclase (GGDEF)-like protein/PAS domain S-box-containing protein
MASDNAVLEALPDAALLLADDDTIVAVNAHACALLGHAVAALLNAPVSVIAPDGLDATTLRSADGTALELDLHVCAAGPGRRLVVAHDATAERRIASQLADAGRLAHVGIWDWHVPSNQVRWSDEMFRLWGLEPDAVDPSYELWLAGVHPDERDWVNQLVQDALTARADYDFEHRVVRHDGAIGHLHCRGQVILDEHGEPLRLVGASQDIGDRISQQSALDHLNGQREAILNAALEGVCGLDSGGRVTFANPSAGQLLELTVPDLVGRYLADMLVSEGANAGELLMAAIAAGRPLRDEDAAFVLDDGRVLPVSYHCAPFRQDGVVAGAVFTFDDVTERNRFESQLQFQADHDALTGLMNRRRFEEELPIQAEAASRFDASLAVVLLDLDNFKDVNDTRGHSVGDELIRAVARVLRNQLRDNDVLARLGGDEFAVLLVAADADGALEIAERLREAVSEHTHVVGGARLHVTASIGIALWDPSQGDPAELLADADVAMYESKEAGRNRSAIYRTDRGGRERMETRLTWTTRLRRALDSDALTLFAQPIRALAGDEDRYEVLLRLRSDDGTVVSPSVFLPTAERHGLIGEIDRWVITRAIELAAEQHGAGRPVCLEINVSGRSLADPDLLTFISGLIDSTGADPRKLVFEVTETAAIENLQEARELASGLGELGCEFALDDFGAGFSSFVHLKHLPVDYMKIDGDFIAGLATSETDQLVVQALIQLARGMGMRTVAEFVSDAATADLLAAYGADFLQGNHIGRPVPIAEALPPLGKSSTDVR